VIVDLGLPDMDGIAVIRKIRVWSPVPLIVLSGRVAEAQRLAVFESGADDYIVKPFSTAELLARVRAALRRYVRELPQGQLKLGWRPRRTGLSRQTGPPRMGVVNRYLSGWQWHPPIGRTPSAGPAPA
jgi:two-component system KDP operon response regulator KdpE